MTRSFLFLFFLSVATLSAEDSVAFNRDIRPILSQHCFACHGPDAHDRKGNLRLDTREGALLGGDSKEPAFIPGKPADSELWKRVTSTDPDEVMPPPHFHKDLSSDQIETLRRWIEGGATYQDHWAYLAPTKPPVPDVEGLTNPIDRFVAHRLAEEDLKLSPQADLPTLLRRLSFDLTGLPPRPETVHNLNPETLDAEIEHLLNSPHFGERMALPWLDASRYADTNGYSIDGGRTMWLWRDWVIHAFNSNLPFDQFIVDQIAGDLLPNPTDSQIIATGFNRNHSITHEGGTIPEENLVNYTADRVKTFGESILGLTTSCAQCHDHKYDPISAEEYYQLFAFFNTLSDKALDGNAGQNARPTHNALTPLATPSEVEAIKNEIAQAQADLLNPDLEAQQTWEKDLLADEQNRGQNFQLIPLKHLSATLPNGNPDRLQVDPSGEFVTVAGPDFSAYNIGAQIPENSPPIHGLRVTFDPGPKETIGHGKNGNLVLNTISPCFSPFPAKNIDHNSLIPAARLTASSTKPGFEPHYLRDPRPLNGWAPADEDTRSPQHVTYTFPSPIEAKDAPYLVTELVFNYQGNQSPAKFRLELFTGNDPDSPHPNPILDLLKIPSSDRSPEQSQTLQTYFQENSPQKAPARYRLANLQERLKVLTEKHSTLVMDTAEKPRVTHFLDRGLYSATQHVVHPGTPAFLPPLAENGEKIENPTRLDLARWLVRPDHPLTARVAVNNLWAIFFGKGLVTSQADFGSQGAFPSHPDLLDYLAVHFQESGWDVKALIRLIVTSQTYRQNSRPSSLLRELDPENALLARGPIFRLPAEHIRDQALVLSGLLVPRIGGPSVKTYHPGDLWRQVSHYGSSPATSQAYFRDHGEKLYRRSIYTYWKRTLPPPEMAAFDAPNREICISDRSATNTPLQAFILLNHPQFIEASRVMAAHLLSEAHPNQRARLTAAFTRVTSRPPTDHELSLLTSSLDAELAKYQADPQGAQNLLAIGDFPQGNLDPAEHAAWTNLCQILLNLSETITRS